MTEWIKKDSQAGGSKRKETYIAHKRFRDDKDDDKDDDKKESTWIKKKKEKKEKKEKQKEWIKKKKKKKDDKEYIEVSTGGLISGLPKLAKKGWK